MPSEAVRSNGEPTFLLEIETPKFIVLREECALARLALARDPASAASRYRLARLLVDMDQFDEAIEILDGPVARVDEFRFASLLGLALLARENVPDTRRAASVAQRAADLAKTPQQRASALATLGKAQIRLGEGENARQSLSAAVRDEPRHKDAFKRLSRLELDSERPDAVVDLSDDLLSRGVDHSLVLMSRSLALVGLGRIDDARALVGIDAFLQRLTPSPPPGWSDLAAFNAGLADELRDHPALRRNRYGVASVDTWRVDEPATPRSPLMLALQGMIQREIIAFAASLSAVDHPWARARPARAILHNWCVMTAAEGYEAWHVHQNGWLSGTYYVEVPAAVAAGTGLGGCIAFGMPEDRVGERNAAGYGEVVVRPRAGLLTLFPSHAFHRTFPHGSETRRICVAFDVVPAPTP